MESGEEREVLPDTVASGPANAEDEPSPAEREALKARLRARLFGKSDSPMQWQSEEDDLDGMVLDHKYALHERLGAGGMGIVYRAEHLRMGKTVAVKVLKPQISSDPEFYERFVREAKSASRIDHPNVVRVTDMGEDDGIAYYVMDHLQGEDLRGMLKRLGHVPWQRMRGICREILDGVAAAHAVDIVHRDLKPDNVFLRQGSGGTGVRVLDFGIAKVLRSDSMGHSITTDGKILGSPRYMSPEQALGRKPDQRSDIYSLGVLFYEALTGVPPFQGTRVLKVLKMHVEDAPPPFAEVAPEIEIEPRVERAVLKALAKDPDDRFQSVAEFGRALEIGDADGIAAGDEGGSEVAPRLPIVAIAAGVVLGGVVASLVTAYFLGALG